jgi:hypothetical protein
VTVRDRVRALPSRWLVVAGSAVAAALVVVAAMTITGDDPGSIDAAATSTPRPTASTPPTSTRSNVVVPSSGEPDASASTSQPDSIDLDDEYELDIDDNDPAVVARPIPEEPDDDAAPPSTIQPPPWAASTRTTQGGHVGVDVGCASDLSAQALDRFFADRVGPVLGWDYQHVYPLGGDRFLWLFQDTFVDHSGAATDLGRSRFVHNAGLLQTGRCFTLLHRGTPAAPKPFEEGDGVGGIRSRWFWPMGGEIGTDGQLWVFWAEMIKDPYDPDPPDGLGWHPERLFIASYDATTLRRTAFTAATDPGVVPIYGYAVSSDTTHTYLFGNTFEQNLVREGGFWNGPHSATQMWLARVPRGQMRASPEYRTADGWSSNRADAVPIVSRFYAENPMQPRFLDGQWVSATDVDGYWGDALAIDVAPAPWGPWTTVDFFELQPRGNDPAEEHLSRTPAAMARPLRLAAGHGLEQRADMLRDAWPRPDRYRPMVIFTPYRATPPPPPPPTAPPAAPPTAPPTSAPVATTTTSSVDLDHLAPTTRRQFRPRRPHRARRR